MKVMNVPTSEVYDTLSKWWAGHKWAAPSISFLPSDVFIVPEVCAAFMYKLNANWTMLEWMIANPEASDEDKSAAQDLLIKEITETSKREGYEWTVTFTPHRKLIKRLTDKHAFGATDQLTVLMKRL